MRKVKDLSGLRFGKLTAIAVDGRDKNGNVTWLCNCDCGKSCVVTGVHMSSGHKKSCGCLNSSDGRRQRVETKHGKSNSRLYRVWATMKNRCHNPNTERYRYYGGRGITVCDEWRNDFQKFYEWAISNGYDENAPFQQCTIDRIDNDKGYSPDNCRWVDMNAQRHNRSDMRE